MMFGGRTAEARNPLDIIDRALDAAAFIDTANVYSRGLSEQAVGKALQRNGKRDLVLPPSHEADGSMDDEDPDAQGDQRRNITMAWRGLAAPPADGLP